MNLLSRLRGRGKVGGLIGFYGLASWWLEEFTEPERRHICERYKPMALRAESLTEGQVTSDQPVTEFLNGLASWFTSKEDAPIAERMFAKMEKLGRQRPVEGPGYFKGRHYTTYAHEIEVLRQDGKLAELESLCIELVGAVEAESKAEGLGVAPAYYLELAWIYRNRNDYTSEVAILERLSQQRHAPNYRAETISRMIRKAQQNRTSGHNR